MIEVLEGGRYQEGDIYQVTVWDVAGSTIDFYLNSEGLDRLKDWLKYTGDDFIEVMTDPTRAYFLKKDSVSTVKVERIE